MARSAVRVLVWNEFRHERPEEAVRATHPDGIHGAIAAGLTQHGLEVRTVTLDEPEQGLSEAALLAICDINRARRESLADAFGVAYRTEAFDDLLGRRDIDVIDICTPPNLHSEQILKALAAGKHVICEKTTSS